MSVIANNYKKRIELGIIDNVNKLPKPWRKETIELLEKDGYIVNEDGTCSSRN